MMEEQFPSFQASKKIGKELKDELVHFDNSDFTSVQIHLPQPQKDLTAPGIKGNYQIDDSALRSSAKKEIERQNGQESPPIAQPDGMKGAITLQNALKKIEVKNLSPSGSLDQHNQDLEPTDNPTTFDLRAPPSRSNISSRNTSRRDYQIAIKPNEFKIDDQLL